MKIGPGLMLLFIPLLAHGQVDEIDDEKAPITWVDSGHAYATNQTQALTQWMDSFFGDPVDDLEQAESFLRLQFIDDWDGEDGHNLKVRLRGKVQLPGISKRLDLVFSGAEDEHLDEDERKQEDTVGLQYNLSESGRSRLDVTLGLSSRNLRPGIRYRNEGGMGEVASYRFLQRVQYHDSEGFFSTSQIDLNRALDNDAALRWSNRIKYGEETDGIEWRSKLALRQRYLADADRPIATSAFLS